jgi:hypothetical protein
MGLHRLVAVRRPWLCDERTLMLCFFCEFGLLLWMIPTTVFALYGNGMAWHGIRRRRHDATLLDSRTWLE